MKSLTIILTRALLILGTAITAQAVPTTIDFSPSGLGTIDGTYAYQWNINWSVPTGDSITGATLTYNTVKLTSFGNNNPGLLWSNLLDTTSGTGTTSVTSFTDNDNASDYWTTGAIGVESFPTLNIAHNFSYAVDLNTLTSYAADGHFAIGIDPDCHFTDSSIVLSVTYDTTPITPHNVVPDAGSTGLLLGIVLPFLHFFRRSK